MRPFNLVHKKTGLTLRQYAKKNKVGVYLDDHKYDLAVADYKLRYCVDESGNPGFEYTAWLDGPVIWWMSKADWDIVEKEPNSAT